MKIKLLLLIASLAFVSCKDEEKTHIVKIQGKYEMELPATFKKATGLNEDASLQYQDLRRELYAIVIDESKKDFDSVITAHSLYDTYRPSLEGYSQLIIDGIDPSVSVDSVSAFKEAKINNLAARRLSMTGSTAGYDIYWKFAFLEGKNRYYQVMVWTRKAYRDAYDKEMDAIIESFRETDRSKKQ